MDVTRSTPSPVLIELLELAGRTLHSIGYAEGLYPAQWTALRYFARMPEGARTASHLARFQGLANGPVSRTVRTLLQKGLLAKAKEQPVGRAEYLEISEAGTALLTLDPMHLIISEIEKFRPAEREVLATALQATIDATSSVWQRNEKEEPKQPLVEEKTA